MHPDAALTVRLDAICARSRYTQDPGPVVDELRAAAGERTEVLHESVGIWCGFEEVSSGAESSAQLRAAIVEAFPECKPWLAEGRERGLRVPHSSRGFQPPV